MNLFSIVRRSLRQHALSTFVTAGSVALAGGLLMSVWVVKQQSQATFTGVNGGFDAVLAVFEANARALASTAIPFELHAALGRGLASAKPFTATDTSPTAEDRDR